MSTCCARLRQDQLGVGRAPAGPWGLWPGPCQPSRPSPLWISSRLSSPAWQPPRLAVSLLLASATLLVPTQCAPCHPLASPAQL